MSKRSWFTCKSSDTEVEITIYDTIGLWGISADELIKEIKAAGSRPITLRINSDGGEVTVGNVIYNRLREHAPGVDVKIDGIAASMASIIALAGRTVSMADNAWMMIHNPMGGAHGGPEDLRRMADVIEKIKPKMIDVYQAKTGISRDELSRMMDDETWMTAQEAKRLGFIDAIDAPLAIAATLRPDQLARFSKAPSALTANPTRMSTEAATASAEETTTTEETQSTEQTQQSQQSAESTESAETTSTAEVDPEKEEAAITARIATLTASDTTLRAQVTDLTAQLTARDTEITSLKAQVSKLQGIEKLYNNVKKSLGVAPAATIPETTPGSEGELNSGSIEERYEKASPEEQARMMADEKTRRLLMEATRHRLN